MIEQALPHLVTRIGNGPIRVTLACGEANDRAWNEALARSLPKVRVDFVVEPAFLYLAEQTDPLPEIRRRISGVLDSLLAWRSPAETVVWVHNPGLGRNLILGAVLSESCARRGIRLIAHHHDWWFDNRWHRWPELRRSGFRSLAATAATVFPPTRGLIHVTINSADARLLGRHLGGQVAWVPNLVETGPAVSAAEAARARRWLRRRAGSDGPIWLLPCRLLRRKNVAEALLLTRWLRPEARLVTTGGVSSADEAPYHARLHAAAHQHGWPLHLGVLAPPGRGAAPSVPALQVASEVLLLTSVQEGFGLPYLEAAAAGRPLVARLLPNVSPDLEGLGFRFAQGYREILVDPGLFDVRAERARQASLFRAWKRGLPATCRSWVELPGLLSPKWAGEPVPFSRLSLTAQLEVLSRTPEESWARCVPWNPFLDDWRQRAASCRLTVGRWPGRAAGRLKGAGYARRFAELLKARGAAARPGAGERAQRDFIRARLSRDYLYPLLWSLES